MNKAEWRTLKDDVKDIYYQNAEEFFLMLKYCLIVYVKSIMSFGFNHLVTKEVVQVWREFLAIIGEEKTMLNYLVRYGSLADADEVEQFMFQLDDLNEQTILYYYDVLNGIETASEMKTEWRAVFPKKEFKTLSETDEYYKELCSITLSILDIKMFLNYEENFWKYIEKKVLFVDSRVEEERDFYGVNIKLDDCDCLVDMKVIVPRIINLETALVNIHEFHHAYCFYQILDRPLIHSDIFYEEAAKNCENRFQEEYMKKKYKRFVEKR